MFTVSVEASASTGVLGNNYGFFTISNELKKLNYSSIMAIFPASATHASANGINGVIGRYNGSSSDLTTWSLAAPSAGTYTVTFVVIYKQILV